MLIDVEGIKREIYGFSKIPDQNGGYILEVQYSLKNISLVELRKIFNVDPNDSDITIRHMVDNYHINASQATALQPYVVYGIIDVTKYDFLLDNGRDESWDWSNGYPPKQIKNVINKIEIASVIKERIEQPYSPLVVIKNCQKSLGLILDDCYWESFYEFRKKISFY